MINLENENNLLKAQNKKEADRILTMASKALLQMNQIPAHENYLVNILGQPKQKSNYGAVRNWIDQKGILKGNNIDPVLVARKLSRELISQIEDFCDY